MKIVIDNKEIELKYSFRALMIYEKITGNSFTNVTGLTEILVFMYSVIISSNKDLSLTWDQYIDWLDNNPNVLTDFTNWLNNIIIRNNYISDSTGEEKKVSEVDSKN